MNGHKVEQEKGYIIVNEDSSEGISLYKNGKITLTSNIWDVAIWTTKEFAEEVIETRGHTYWGEDIDPNKLHVEEVVYVTSKTIIQTSSEDVIKNLNISVDGE